MEPDLDSFRDGREQGWRDKQAEIERLKDVQMYDRNLIKTLSAEIERLRNGIENIITDIVEDDAKAPNILIKLIKLVR